jgi:TatD DNase family protein
MLIDSHCHLDFPDLADRLPEVLARARAAGIRRIVTISTFVARHAVYRAIAEDHEGVYCTVGTHPHNAAMEPDVLPDRIAALSEHPRCIAIGEAGLDYFYDNCPRDVQQRVFRAHIGSARDTGLPLIIHARSADEDMIDILQDETRRGRFSAVLHCFTSGPELAEIGVELGFAISFSGIITFKKSDALRRIAASVPRDRLLVETDAPYLAPDPHRGKTNEPAFVVHTARVLARIVGVTEEEVARLTSENFHRFFPKAATPDPAHRAPAA